MEERPHGSRVGDDVGVGLREPLLDEAGMQGHHHPRDGLGVELGRDLAARLGPADDRGEGGADLIPAAAQGVI